LFRGRFVNPEILQTSAIEYRRAFERRKKEMTTLNPVPISRGKAAMKEWRESVVPRLLLGDDSYLMWTMSKKTFFRTVMDAVSVEYGEGRSLPGKSLSQLRQTFPVDIAMPI
jgi:hypothetical protein